MPTYLGLTTRVWSYFAPRVPSGVLYYAGGGLGDELMLTAVAQAARLAGRPLSILTDLPEVWTGNSDPTLITTGIERWFYAQKRAWIADVRIQHLTTSNFGRSHLAQQAADHLGLKLSADWAPNLRFTKRPSSARRIVFQLSCRGARYAADTKEWAHERWLELLARLSDYELVQLGTLHDPAVPGVLDLRGRTTLAEAASWIDSAALFLGLESGLTHVAAATRVRAVIIQGGRTAPSLTGYPWHVHLTRTPACAGCALNSGCPHDRVCLDIPVVEVEAAVRKELTRE